MVVTRSMARAAAAPSAPSAAPTAPKKSKSQLKREEIAKANAEQAARQWAWIAEKKKEWNFGPRASAVKVNAPAEEAQLRAQIAEEGIGFTLEMYDEGETLSDIRTMKIVRFLAAGSVTETICNNLFSETKHIFGKLENGKQFQSTQKRQWSEAWEDGEAYEWKDTVDIHYSPNLQELFLGEAFNENIYNTWMAITKPL